MARLFYGHILVDGVRINYYRTGGEKPPMILLHGMSDNALCWNRIPILLEPEFDLVMLDARGHGSSGDSPQGYGLDLHAGDVQAVIEHMQLKRPIIMGHSMGAEVAALAAARMPKVVRGVVLIDPPWRPVEEKPAPEQAAEHAAAWKQDLALKKEKSLDEVVAMGKAKHPYWEEDEFFQWAKSKQQVRLEALDWLAAPRTPWWEIVRKIDCPGLLVAGDPALGGIVTPEVSKQVTHAWRKCKEVRIANVGHSIHREDLLSFMDALNLFLRKLGK